MDDAGERSRTGPPGGYIRFHGIQDGGDLPPHCSVNKNFPTKTAIRKWKNSATETIAGDGEGRVEIARD